MNKVISEAMAIVDNSDFNSLPLEERKKICRYKTEQQILTLIQVIEKDSHITTKAWREKQIEWLMNIVKDYKSEYKPGANNGTDN